MSDVSIQEVREMLLTIFMLFRVKKSEVPQQTELMTWRGDTGRSLSRAEDGQQQPAAERVPHPRVRGGLQQVRRDAVRPRVHQAARQPPQAPRHQPHQGGAAGSKQWQLFRLIGDPLNTYRYKTFHCQSNLLKYLAIFDIYREFSWFIYNLFYCLSTLSAPLDEWFCEQNPPFLYMSVRALLK